MSTRGASPDPVPSDRRLTALEKESGTGVFTQAEIDALVDDLLEGVMDATSLDRIMAERLAKNLLLARFASEQAEAEPFVMGSRKQLVEHPGHRIAARCDQAALSLARQLGLERRRVVVDPELDNVIELARAEARRKGRDR